jgi:hypothetical protein
MYVITDQLFWSGTTAAGYHHVGYFDCPKRREHYDDFYGKVLQVVDVNALSFADHVQNSVRKQTACGAQRAPGEPP